MSNYKLCSPTILLRKQVEKAYKDSFREKLTSEINAGSEEGVIWLCVLHRELIIRVCSYLKRNTKVQDEIAEHCDPVIFKQLLQNKCYKLEDLSGLINYVYSWLQKLCAPIRDNHLKASLQDLNDRIVKCGEGGCQRPQFSELICDFIVRVHSDMDVLDGDFNSKECEEFKGACSAFLKGCASHNVPS